MPAKRVAGDRLTQVCQVVGWLPVHPIGEFRLPYWAGLWFGVFPTWEGVAAQVGAALFVLGSYAGAEWLRGRSRRAKLERLDAAPPARAPEPVAVTELASARVREPVGGRR